MNSLFAGWSQKKFSEVIFKKAKENRAPVFGVYVTTEPLCLKSFILYFFASWSVSYRLYPRHCSIDKMLMYRGSVYFLHQNTFLSYAALPQIFFIG